jgi:hypothetical protein
VPHDVIEDYDEPDDHLDQRCPALVCGMVDALTHQEGEDYPSSSKRVSRTPGAFFVKEADIRDNRGCLHLIRGRRSEGMPPSEVRRRPCQLEGLR